MDGSNRSDPKISLRASLGRPRQRLTSTWRPWPTSSPANSRRSGRSHGTPWPARGAAEKLTTLGTGRCPRSIRHGARHRAAAQAPQSLPNSRDQKQRSFRMKVSALAWWRRMFFDCSPSPGPALRRPKAASTSKASIRQCVRFPAYHSVGCEHRRRTSSPIRGQRPCSPPCPGELIALLIDSLLSAVAFRHLPRK